MAIDTRRRPPYAENRFHPEPVSARFVGTKWQSEVFPLSVITSVFHAHLNHVHLHVHLYLHLQSYP